MAADILGPDFVARRIALRADGEGEVVATLVHTAGAPRHRRAVLYVHGFVDYFFQTHMAEEWDARGYDFYALDLRKYGRSLLPHQTPNFCRDLADYDEELDEAARIIRAEHNHQTLVVMGHSTGGLVTSLWVARRPGLAQALVLNSPWLDLAGTWFRRVVMTAMVDMVGAVSPMAMVMEKLPDP
ncbi:MAG: alpha/beta hydrolase, partial [Alphaproteobacteria bacterium]